MKERLVKSYTFRLTIILLGALYTVSPVLYWFWLVHELNSGAFPPEADSIGIPMAGFLLLWVIGWFLIVFGALASTIFAKELNE